MNTFTYPSNRSPITRAIREANRSKEMAQSTQSTQDYLYLRAWNQMMGSHVYWCETSLEKARAENAPANATYNENGIGAGGRWHTFDEVTNLETHALILRIISESTHEPSSQADQGTKEDHGSGDLDVNRLVSDLEAVGLPVIILK